MEELVRHLQELQRSEGAFVGKREEVLRQLAALEEVDPDFAKQRVVKTARIIARREVAPLLDRLAPEGYLTDTAFHDAVTHVTQCDKYLKYVERTRAEGRHTAEHIADECAAVTGEPYMLAPVTSAVERNPNRATSGSVAQIFTLDDEYSDNGELDPVQFHANLRATMEALGGIAIETERCILNDVYSETEHYRAVEKDVVEERLAVLAMLQKMAADVTDTECWPSVRENLVAAVVDPHPHVADATLRTLVEVAKTAEAWQVAQLAVALCRRLTPLFKRHEEEAQLAAPAAPIHDDEDAMLAEGSLRALYPQQLHGIMKFLHTSLRVVETSWMFLPNLDELFQGLSDLLACRRALALFAAIDPSAAWFEAFARCGGVRKLLFSQSTLLLLCAQIAFCEPFDTDTASVGALTSQQRCLLLQKPHQQQQQTQRTLVGGSPHPHAQPGGNDGGGGTPAPQPGTPNPGGAPTGHPRTPGRVGSEAGVGLDAAVSLRGSCEMKGADVAPSGAGAAGATTAACANHLRTLSTTPSHGRGGGGGGIAQTAVSPDAAMHAHGHASGMGTHSTPAPLNSTAGSPCGEDQQGYAAGGDALTLHALHIMGVCLVHPEGVARFPLVIPDANKLMPLHMFATRSTTTTLLLADEFLVASSAVHGVILHMLKGLYYSRRGLGGWSLAAVGGGGATPPPMHADPFSVDPHLHWLDRQKKVTGLAHACMDALLQRGEIDSPVATLLVVNYVQPMIDISHVAAVAALEGGGPGVLPLGRRPEMEDVLVGGMRCLAQLARLPSGRELLTQPHARGTLPDVESLLSVAVKFLGALTKQPWAFSECVLREAPPLAAVLLARFPAGLDVAKNVLADVAAFVLDPPPRLAESVGNPRALCLGFLDAVLDALASSATLRQAVAHQPLTAALIKRAVIRTLSRREGCEGLPLLTVSADLLAEVNSIEGIPGVHLCQRHWQAYEGVAHFGTHAHDAEAHVARQVWGLQRASMLCSTTWQTKSSLLKPTVTGVLSVEGVDGHPRDEDVHIAELSAVAAASVMLLDATLVLLNKHDAQRQLLTAQQQDTSLHPASLLRHIMLCAVGTVGGPSERRLPRSPHFGWPLLFVQGPWEEPPEFLPPLGEVCDAHCGVLISDAEATDPPVMVSAPEVSEADPTPLFWSYPNPPSALYYEPPTAARVKPEKMEGLAGSLRSTIEKLAAAVASGMEQARGEWLEGVGDILWRALRMATVDRETATPTAGAAGGHINTTAVPTAGGGGGRVVNGGAALPCHPLFLSVLHFVAAGDTLASASATPAGEPHALAQTAATLGVRYGMAIGLLDGSEQTHIQTLRAYLPDIDWRTVVLYIAAGDALLPLARHPALRYVGGETQNTLKLATAVEYVLQHEAPSLVSFMTTHSVPLLYVVHVWVRQVFLNFFDWTEVLAAVTFTLLHGPEELVFILAACVLHMKPVFLASLAHPHFSPAYLATLVAVTPVVDAHGRPFRLAQHIDALQAMKAAHLKQVAKLLS